jgi:hypothetical protein
MFVRWKRRALLERVSTYEKRPSPWGDGTLTFMSHRDKIVGWIRTAYLIKAIRTPEGPRQEYLCRLGSFQEDYEGDREEREQFWDDAQWGVLEHVDPDDRDQIVAALVAVIPKPKGWDGRI